MSELSFSGASDTPQRNRNDHPDLMRAMPVKVSARDGKPCYKLSPLKLSRPWVL